MTRKEIVCFVCEHPLDNDHSDGFGSVIPGILDATVWRATGNWGSSLFDPLDNDGFLETYICDRCLVKKSHLVYNVEIETKKTEEVKVDTFNNYHSVKYMKELNEKD